MQLGVADPTKLQVVHMAYSTNGKLAMTGYYNDSQEERSDRLAGLWTADVINGQIANMHPQPIPQPPNGITDLQWSPERIPKPPE